MFCVDVSKKAAMTEKGVAMKLVEYIWEWHIYNLTELQ